MQLLHVSYMNGEYHPDVIAGWQAGRCFAEMERRLGYRLLLTAATLPVAARPGGELALELQLRNEGWAAPFNRRPMILVLEGGGQRRELDLDVDLRQLRPGDHPVKAHVTVPAGLAPGRYRLALWLPDAEPALRGRPAYAIRLANEDIYVEATGDHTLGTIDVAAR
jgi:hypothetical protein